LEKWLAWLDELSQQDYVIIDGFLDEDFYKKMRCSLLSKLPQFAPAGIGALEKHALRQEVRGDNTYWLDPAVDDELLPFWELVDETIYIFKRYCYLSLAGSEFHFAQYPPGGHYDTHLDQFDGRSNRVISMIIYLNEDWKKGDGGELEILQRDGSAILVQPVKGRCVMFKSDVVPHGVLRSNADRYSLTGWLLHLPGSLGQILG